jgi:acetylornithine/succinyldiaminopimelate/putrescine aminotransferase
MPVACSLADLAGADVVDAACRARSWLSGEDLSALRRLATEPVEFWPEALQRRLRELLPQAGQPVIDALPASADGAAPRAVQTATKKPLAPLSGLGYFRVGEDGRLYVVSKSEHYHTPLGHGFPGYQLLERARALGIPNATHNNTRGPITRRLEEELIRAANGLPPGSALKAVLASDDPAVPNRVINLETGSLAAEAAFKLALAHFYRHEPSGATPTWEGRVPVFLIVGDDDGRVSGNYHGTTVLTQVMRGLWPALRDRLEQAMALRVVAVRPNSIADLERAFGECDAPPYKIAAFVHELVMMNYGARRLDESFLRHAYRLCAASGVPAIVDEIQSCMWYDGLFLFRHYGLRPSMVVVGKGFTGGEYAASRLLFSAAFDALPQFGALVTNGQEELAALAYLVTLRWTAANGAAIATAGRCIEGGVRALAAEFPSLLTGVEGQGHLLGLRFADVARGRHVADAMNRMGFDMSVQTYKADCPPVALTKLPTIADDALIDAFLERLRLALRQVAERCA